MGTAPGAGAGAEPDSCCCVVGAVGCVATGDWLGLSLPRRAPDLPLAAASLGEAAPVGVEDAEAVVAIDEGVAGAMDESEVGEEVEMEGGPVPFGLVGGWGAGSGLLVGCWAAG